MLFELNYFPREIIIETISLEIIVMISHQNYLSKISNWIFMCKIVILSVDLQRSTRRILILILLINSLNWLELLLKHVYCWYIFLILLLRTSICVFLIAIFSQNSDVDKHQRDSEYDRSIVTLNKGWRWQTSTWQWVR
jgi:hypothetical protein